MTVREYGSGHVVNDAVIGLVRRQAPGFGFVENSSEVVMFGRNINLTCIFWAFNRGRHGHHRQYMET